MPLRPRGLPGRLFLVALGFSAGVLPVAAHAQVRTSGRNFAIAYESGSASRNGYMDAQVQVTYYFGVCAGQVAFLARYEATPHMLVGNHRYWVDGRQVSVPPHITPPRIESPVVRGTIRGPNTVREINYVHATPAPTPSCLTNDLGLGQTSNFWPANTPLDRQIAILNQFGLDYRGTLPPLRNSAVEAHFRQIFAQERTDSLNRARAAEQARLAARRDSIQRATAAREAERAAQQRAASASGAGAAAAGGNVASSGSGSSGSGSAGSASTGQQDPAAAERAAAAQAAAERAAAEERGRIAAEEFRQRVAEDEARQEQIEEAAVATATAAVGIISALMEARENRIERKRAEEAQRQREAQARYQAYVATTRARFAAAPPQPTCTMANLRDSVTLSMRTRTRTITLGGDECRLQGGQSAEMLLLVLDEDAPVVLTPSSSPVLNQLYLLDASTGRGVTSASESGIAYNLPRGRYVLVAGSRLPGEVGDIKLDLRKGWVADAHGSVGGAGGPSKAIEGFVGTNSTSTSWMDLNLTLEFRRRLPALTMSLMIPTDSDAQEGMVDVGLRQYLGRPDAKLRPWVEASVGYREIFVLQEPFRTFSPAVGAGLHWRFSDEYGLAVSATQLTGKASNTDDVWTSPPPDVPLGRMVLRLGLMIH